MEDETPATQWPQVRSGSVPNRGESAQPPGRTAAQLDGASLAAISGTPVGSEGFALFALAMCSLILVWPLLLVLVGSLGPPGDHARTAQVVWGVVLAACGLSVFALMAMRKTEVGWDGLRRGFSFAAARSSIPWDRVEGFVLEPDAHRAASGRIWVVHRAPAGILDADRVPSGLSLTPIDRARAVTDELNAGLGVAEPVEELRALKDASRSSSPRGRSTSWWASSRC